jgi:hypothetical protein
MTRSPSSPGVDASATTCWPPTCRPPVGAELASRPLAECLDSYFFQQAVTRVPSPPATSSTTLLDQLPDIGVAVRDRPLVELLRPIYLAHGDVKPDRARRLARP